jgi:ribosomal protein L22
MTPEEKPTDEQAPKEEAKAKRAAAKKPAAKSSAAAKPAAAKKPVAKKLAASEGEEGAAPKAKPAPARKAPAKKDEPVAAKETAAEKPSAKKPVAGKAPAKKEPVAETASEAKAEKPAPAKAEKPAAAPVRRKVVRAQARYVRTSARKARMVCGHLRGKSVPEARAILAFTPREVARDWSKLLESAVANAENNHELVEDDLFVREAYADEGPTIKRFRPRAQGRATPIRKRTSHLTITLTPKP